MAISFLLRCTLCFSLASVACSQVARAAYALTQTYDISNFLDAFEFRTAADYPGSGDPTNGFVNYLSASNAKSKGLAKVINNQVYLGADNTSVISTSSQGRNSIRLESKATFSSGLLIADIAHMPGNACGIWPAFWTYNMLEEGHTPPVGEIDIVEGCNYQSDNIISLHTCNTCKFTAGKQTGTDHRSNCALGGDCYDSSTNFDGCGVTAAAPSSFGDAFNKANGGVYALELTSTSIKIWHFPRSSIPADITSGTPDPSKWATPMGDFEKSNGGCDVGGNFQTQTIIINTDFCGDEPDGIWSEDPKCNMYSSCKNFVANHPEAFSEAYWLWNSLKLYQQK